jgi:hypothetical protein
MIHMILSLSTLSIVLFNNWKNCDTLHFASGDIKVCKKNLNDYNYHYADREEFIAIEVDTETNY